MRWLFRLIRGELKMNPLKEALLEHICEERLVGLVSDMIRIPSYYGVPNQETGAVQRIPRVPWRASWKRLLPSRRPAR